MKHPTEITGDARLDACVKSQAFPFEKYQWFEKVLLELVSEQKLGVNECLAMIEHGVSQDDKSLGE